MWICNFMQYFSDFIRRIEIQLNSSISSSKLEILILLFILNFPDNFRKLNV